MNPTPGIEEYPQPEVKGSHLPATVVRNVLRWTKTEDRAQVFLVDVTGRKVLELKPGENDVRHLSPGVYFIRDGSAIERKVAIAR
ncbi:MAG: T9SS type A sorting domain-containing protein [candidate division WOR-3 bacterium]